MIKTLHMQTHYRQSILYLLLTTDLCKNLGINAYIQYKGLIMILYLIILIPLDLSHITYRE